MLFPGVEHHPGHCTLQKRWGDWFDIVKLLDLRVYMHLDSMDSRFHLQRECQFVKLLNARRNLIVQCYDIGFRKVVHSIQSSEHGCVLLYCCKENYFLVLLSVE